VREKAAGSTARAQPRGSSAGHGRILNSFVRHVAAELPVIRRGPMRLYPVAAIER